MSIRADLYKSPNRSFPVKFFVLVLLVGGTAGFAGALRSAVASHIGSIKADTQHTPKAEEGVKGKSVASWVNYSRNSYSPTSAKDDGDLGKDTLKDRKQEGSRKNKMEPKGGKREILNQNPIVTIDMGLEGRSYTYADLVSISAQSYDSDGKVSTLGLVVNDVTYITVTASTYTFELNSLPLGIYQIYAFAQDDRGGVGKSRTITIYVDPANAFDPDISEPISGPISYSISGSLSKDISTAVSGDLSAPISWIISGPISGGISDSISTMLSKDLSVPISTTISGYISKLVSTPISGGLSTAISDGLSGAISETISDILSRDISKTISEGLSAPISWVLSGGVSGALSTPISGIVSTAISEIISGPVSNPVSLPVSGIISGGISNIISTVVFVPISSDVSTPVSDVISNVVSMVVPRI